MFNIILKHRCSTIIKEKLFKIIAFLMHCHLFIFDSFYSDHVTRMFLYNWLGRR